MTKTETMGKFLSAIFIYDLQEFQKINWSNTCWYNNNADIVRNYLSATDTIIQATPPANTYVVWMYHATYAYIGDANIWFNISRVLEVCIHVVLSCM
jgi:hypothetical protein